MTNRLGDDPLERDKQIVAIVLKEAELMRAEILSIGTGGRNVLVTTVTFLGVLLAVTAGLLSLKTGNGDDLAELVRLYRWPLWVISVVSVITCLMFLRLYVGAHAGIFDAATYYRDVLARDLNRLLKTGTDPEVLGWESWLGRERAARRGFRSFLSRPGEELITTPVFIAVIGLILAGLGLATIMPEGGARCLFLGKGFFVFAGSWLSVFLTLLIIGALWWVPRSMVTIQERFDRTIKR
jgi:hypothetical protein